jgi:hypothetical protein
LQKTPSYQSTDIKSIIHLILSLHRNRSPSEVEGLNNFDFNEVKRTMIQM